MITYNFTTDELASRLPLGPNAVVYTIELIRMIGQLQHQVSIRSSRDGARPTTQQVSANMVELMLDLDGKITTIQQDGDQVTITTDAEAPGDEPVTIYDLAQRAVEERAAAFPDEPVSIWRGVCFRIFIRRYQGLLTLYAVNGDPRKAQRVRCGHLSQDGWHFTLSRADYDCWAARARQLQ